MPIDKLYFGQNSGKRRLTFLELLLIAPFVLFLVYVGTGSIAVTDTTKPAAQPVAAAPAVEAPAAAPVEPAAPAQAVAKVATPAVTQQAEAQAPAPADTIKIHFVTTGTTSVLDRIAPVATVTIEGVAAPVAAVESAAPAMPVTAEAPKTEPAPATAQAVPVTAEAPKQTGALRVEISDATGKDGLARTVAQTLEQAGVTIANIASLPAGKQRRNVILFRDGFEEEARRLGKFFAHAPALVNNTKTRDREDTSDVRLVLGSAAAREANLFASTDSNMPKLSLGRLARQN